MAANGIEGWKRLVALIGVSAIVGGLLAIGQFKERVLSMSPRLTCVEQAVVEAKTEREQLRGILSAMDSRQEARQDELLRRFDRLEKQP